MRQSKKSELKIVRREISITNRLGLHARPAAEFVRRSNSFESEIWVVKSGCRYSAASLIEMMRANLEYGGSAILEASGTDANSAIEQLAAYVRTIRDE